jgi:HD-like signal output (HDOD) protein
MWMPGMNGAKLLNEVARLHPQTIRFVLSGHSDEKSILSLVGTAHRYLAKPCDPEKLKSVLERAFLLCGLLQDDTLKSLIGSIDSLPSYPVIYQKLTRKLADPDTSLRELGRLIAEDPPITAKMLQMVNSSFFGIGRRISNPEEAASLLGMDTLKSLVLSTGIFRQFETGDGSESASLKEIWQHSIAVGCLARDIVRKEVSDPSRQDDALSAGLLHDIGLMLFLFRLPDLWEKVQAIVASEGISHWQAEERVTGATHSKLGAYLLGLWGLPEEVVEAIAFTHTPGKAPTRSFGTLTAVHVADALLQDDQRLDEGYLASLGMENRIAAWRTMAESIRAESEQ